jgi:light-regulated signal transduction histidine kinase (bacteriophytochrome)
MAMSTADGKQARYNSDQIYAALEAETRSRLEVEDRLRRTNEEFQEFILNAAHDLREPLRTVNAYCELLARKDTQGADPETDQFRRYILEGTGKIQALIAGMVEYASAAADSRYLLRIDMNEVLREAAAYPTPDSRRRAALVTSDPLPVARGDFEKLVKVVRHLLDNAARYCEDASARTHVSSRRDGADWIFLVKDNGPGVDAAYQERIFEPFKRLHGRHYAGNGLGLAFCQRAIESLGGRIWVESRPGEGSSFCFTLPAAD